MAVGRALVLSVLLVVCGVAAAAAQTATGARKKVFIELISQ